MKRYCLALDLIDEPELIEEYVKWHRDVWPEIQQSILDSGIGDMEIYLVGNRLFMIIDAEEHFSFEDKSARDAANASVQEWEQLMWKFQKPLPWAKEGEKWMLMDMIFKLEQPKGLETTDTATDTKITGNE